MLLRSGAREIVEPLRGVRRGGGVGRACSRGARRTESGPGEIGRGDDDDEEEEFLHRGSWWHAGRGHGDPATPSKVRLALGLGRDEAAPAVVGTARGGRSAHGAVACPMARTSPDTACTNRDTVSWRTAVELTLKRLSLHCLTGPRWLANAGLRWPGVCCVARRE